MKLFIIAIFFISYGCSPIMGIYGIKKPKEITEKKIARYSKRMEISPKDVFELDTAYFSYLFSFNTINLKQQIKNHYQPLQALYFNKNEQLESFQINCYAGGFPNINWERDSIFSTFPPKQQAPTDTLISIRNQIKYLLPLSQSEKINVGNQDYLVFVYWSRFMGRQSRRFIKLIKKNSALNENESIRIVYINTDNLFVLSDLW